MVSASFGMLVALIDYNPIVLCRLSAIYQLSIHCSQMVSASFAMLVALIDYNPIALCRLSAIYQLSIHRCSQMVNPSFGTLILIVYVPCCVELLIVC
jgi:hypothetical protein